MSDQFPERPDHPDFWMMSQIITDQDNRATSHADSFESLIAEVVDVQSLIYMASQRALRARILTTGSFEEKMISMWIDAFVAGVEFAKTKP